MSSLLQNKKIILASHNPGKIKEFQDLLEPLGIVLTPLDSPEHEAPEETGATFRENALIKAKHAAEHQNCLVLADDSGLEIEVLDNQPGVYTGRRYYEAGGLQQIAEKLEKDLRPFTNKRARFVCVLCLYYPDDTFEFFEGHVEGQMVFPPRGNNSFGYDPIFQPLGHQRTFAQMPAAEKHALSHRAKAVDQLIRAHQ
ncbi:MAG: RdgB/HAM1 family non-canonical purine NTP pyrophosphatase [Pseudomonadota bacterium]